MAFGGLARVGVSQQNWARPALGTALSAFVSLGFGIAAALREGVGDRRRVVANAEGGAHRSTRQRERGRAHQSACVTGGGNSPDVALASRVPRASWT